MLLNVVDIFSTLNSIFYIKEILYEYANGLRNSVHQYASRYLFSSLSLSIER